MIRKHPAVVFACAALSFSLFLSACAAKGEDVLIGTRVEAAHMSFILPEGWGYEEIEGLLLTRGTDRPRNDIHGAVALYPPTRDADLPWDVGPYLLNASYLYEQHAMYRADYQKGMTLDEWVEARLSNMPEDLYRVEQEQLSGNAHVFYYENILFDTIPDYVSYMCVKDDLAVVLFDGGMAGLTEEDQALLASIIESVQPLEKE